MLELRPNCEKCGRALPPDSTEARICSYECTFCATCAGGVLGGVCPNCGGGFVPRPIRPARAGSGGSQPGLHRAHLRVARPTDDLAAAVAFYRDGLGFEVLYEFKDHDGFDGVMLGHRDAAYHLEFTRRAGHRAGRSPGEENLLVFYLPDDATWKAAVERMERAGYHAVKAFNPYWDRRGRTFEDRDGYRVVLENSGWTA